MTRRPVLVAALAMRARPRRLRSQHDGAAEAQHLRADDDMVGRHICPAAAGWCRRARRVERADDGKKSAARHPMNC